jgi:antitoxin component YwqK of YwqJK toxin-antitoxin module
VKYPTGQLQARFPFVEGQLHGVADYWFENGVKSASIPWFKGQMHGRAKFYTEANRLRQTNSYRLGKLHGLSSWYDDKGEVTYRALYEEDQVLSCDRNILDALAKKVGE